VFYYYLKTLGEFHHFGSDSLGKSMVALRSNQYQLNV
jgi:hypothetical protein